MNVNNIVVCGHSNCGGCEAIYYEEKELNKMPHTKKWLELMEPIKNVIQNKIDTKEISMEQRGLFTEQMNVLEQINHLMRYPYIRSRVKKGELNILGWYYVIEEGNVYNYDPKQKAFVKID